MVDIWHKVGRVIRISNLGTLIFFVLNAALLVLLFCPGGIFDRNFGLLLCLYLVSVLIGVSPAGESFLAFFMGAQEIKRKDIKIRLIPLLEIVADKAKHKNPSRIRSIHLKIIHENAPNAFAVGRRTICVTDGLLELTDEEIMAVLAHEMGHLVYGHSTIQLLIGGGNFLISGCILLIKAICWGFTAVCGMIAGVVSNNFWIGAVSAVFSGISVAAVWVWTKFCSLFLMWSMRKNELLADRYAFDLGFGDALARVLDGALRSPPENSLLKALYSSHPHTDDRIAQLQNLGVAYSRY